MAIGKLQKLKDKIYRVNKQEITLEKSRFVDSIRTQQNIKI